MDSCGIEMLANLLFWQFSLPSGSVPRPVAVLVPAPRVMGSWWPTAAAMASQTSANSGRSRAARRDRSGRIHRRRWLAFEREFMNTPAHLVLTFVAVALGTLLASASAFAQSRGELLYVTHCGACHTSQIHWRAARAVTDWPSLVAQVRKWQDTATLGWTDADITDVARYLNDNTYHFEQTIGALTRLPSATPHRLPRSIVVESQAFKG